MVTWTMLYMMIGMIMQGKPDTKNSSNDCLCCDNFLPIISYLSCLIKGCMIVQIWKYKIGTYDKTTTLFSAWNVLITSDYKLCILKVYLGSHLRRIFCLMLHIDMNVSLIRPLMFLTTSNWHNTIHLWEKVKKVINN